MIARSEGLWLAWDLAGIAGCVDVIGFLVLGRLYTAHMSGNTSSAGRYLGAGQWAEGFRDFWPIPVFVFGVFIGAVIVEKAIAKNARRPLLLPLVLEVILLCLFALVILVKPNLDSIRAQYGMAIAILPCLAMGVQNASLRRVGHEGVRTTYITGMLTDFAEELATFFTSKKPRERSFALKLWGGLWVVYFCGAVLGALLFGAAKGWALFLPVLGLLAAIVKELTTPSQGVSTVKDLGEAEQGHRTQNTEHRT